MEEIKIKEKIEPVKKKELVDIEIMKIMKPIEEKEKEIIKLDENLKKHIEGKILILDNHYKLNLNFLYYKISRRKRLKYLDIYYFQDFEHFVIII